jgi:alpha-tubulin suppressor-like RCC1 family protein
VVHGAGEVACFGSNASGQLGRGAGASSGAHPEAAPVEGALRARSVVLTNSFALAIGTDERLWSWGNNGGRQLGRATAGPDTAPESVPAIADAVMTSPRACGGTSFTGFIVSPEGELLSWGGGPYDQLGRATSLYADPAPAAIAVSDVTSVVTGTNHACALGRGAVRCWGWNEHGELGTGRKADELLPAQVLLPPGVYPVAVAAGGDDTCIITAKGELYCWGANGSGQLGTTSRPDSAQPMRIGGLAEEAVAVAVMDEAVCALLRSGVVNCWGENFLGQLGRGTRELESSPAPGPVVFE